MVIMETHCIETESVCKQCKTGKCLMENVDEVEVQTQDRVTGNPQLVRHKRNGELHLLTIVQVEGL
jgi:hypothetical protein